MARQFGAPLETRGKAYTVAQTVRRNVYLFCKGEWDGAVIRAEVEDMAARDDKGNPIPPVIVIPCPRCSRGLKIDGVAKKTTIQYLDEPRQLDLREVGFGIVEQTAVVNVTEDMGCPHVNSDAPCGARFRITDNVLHKVGAGRR